MDLFVIGSLFGIALIGAVLLTIFGFMIHNFMGFITKLKVD